MVAALLSALLATVLMIAIERFATENLVAELTANAGRVAISVERGRLDYPLAHHRSRNMQVVDSQGRVVASTEDLRGKAPMTDVSSKAQVTTRVVCGGVFPPGVCNVVVAQRARYAGQSWIVYSASPVIPPWVDPWLAADTR